MSAYPIQVKRASSILGAVAKDRGLLFPSPSRGAADLTLAFGFVCLPVSTDEGDFEALIAEGSDDADVHAFGERLFGTTLNGFAFTRLGDLGGLCEAAAAAAAAKSEELGKARGAGARAGAA